MDAGVFVEQSAAGAVVEENRIEGNLYGIYLHGAENAVARNNQIIGIGVGRMNEAGNGVSVWNAPGAQVLDNDIRLGRDGIFVIASQRNVFRGNHFRDLRFAVHYMYTNDSEVSDNVSTGNTVGFAIMYSHHLKVRDNVSDGDRDRGFLFNFANGSEIVGNSVYGRLQPAERWAGAASAVWRRKSMAYHHRTVPNSRSTRAHATGPKNVSSSTMLTATCFGTTGLRAARSAFILPQDPRATIS